MSSLVVKGMLALVGDGLIGLLLTAMHCSMQWLLAQTCVVLGLAFQAAIIMPEEAHPGPESEIQMVALRAMCTTMFQELKEEMTQWMLLKFQEFREECKDHLDLPVDWVVVLDSVAQEPELPPQEPELLEPVRAGPAMLLAKRCFEDIAANYHCETAGPDLTKKLHEIRQSLDDVIRDIHEEDHTVQLTVSPKMLDAEAKMVKFFHIANELKQDSFGNNTMGRCKLTNLHGLDLHKIARESMVLLMTCNRSAAYLNKETLNKAIECAHDNDHVRVQGERQTEAMSQAHLSWAAIERVGSGKDDLQVALPKVYGDNVFTMLTESH